MDTGTGAAGREHLRPRRVEGPGTGHHRTSRGWLPLVYTAVGPGRSYPECQGYILSAIPEDGLDFTFEPGERIRSDIDAVHAEDMSVITLGDGRRRMYYAACDSDGRWRIASEVSDS